MPIMVTKDHFLNGGNSLRYISPWDRLFQTNSAKLKFYPMNPEEIVCVNIYEFDAELSEDDIVVSYGGTHNCKEIEEIAKRSGPEILEVCTTKTNEVEFALDLKTMDLIKRKDFTDDFPRFGMSTPFIFEGIDNGFYYCLYNPSVGAFSSEDLLIWLLTYIETMLGCFGVFSATTSTAKEFLFNYTFLKHTRGKKPENPIFSHPSIFGCPLNVSPTIVSLDVGKETRLKALAEKADKEYRKALAKRQKQKGAILL